MREEPIAIVGIGCRFPGANSPTALYDNLIAGKNSISPIPAERVLLKRHALAGERRERIPDYGGFLEDMTQFDSAQFRFSPREAQATDPQHRLILQVASEALEDAAISSDALRGAYVPVFVGALGMDYQSILFSDAPTLDLYGAVNTTFAALAGRVAHCFDWSGPAVGLDTACSSSLTAMHLACQAVWSGDAELALFGATNVLLLPEPSLAYTRAGMLAPDGQCKAFDARGDGFVRSEGAAAIIVKRLSAALRDANPIYAIVRATWLNHDGGKGQYKTPHRAGQRQMLEQVYARAGLSPLDTQYVEAHGTGTRAGDPVEVNALGDVMCAGRPRETPLYIGSVKPNIGHCEAAAGMASLTKTALSLRAGVIPKNLHFHDPNPAIAWDELALRVPTETTEWAAPKGKPARAGISAFGLSGVNAHVILEAPPARPPARDMSGRATLWLISAPDRERVQLSAQRLDEALARGTAQDSEVMHSVARTLAVGRKPYEFRTALFGERIDDLREALATLARGESGSTAIHEATPASSGQEATGATPGVCFVFSGQGGQWAGMGERLMDLSDSFAQTLEQVSRAIEAEAGFHPITELSRPESESRLHDHAIVQPSLFAVQVALAALWQSIGVQPNAVVGHSMGEVSAAYVAGILDLPDAVKVICRRSRIMKQAPGQGAMLVVDLPEVDIADLIAIHPTAIALGVHNSPASRVLSGDKATLQQIAAELEARGQFARFVNVDLASHSPQMDPIKTELLEALKDVRGKPGRLAFHSTVRRHFGRRPHDGPCFDAQYFWENLRHTVRFSDAIADLVQQGCELFVEIGPHPLLCQAIAQTQASGPRPIALPSMRRNEDERDTLLRTGADLFVRGIPVKWHELLPAAALLNLPPTPPRAEHYEIDFGKRYGLGARPRQTWHALPIERIDLPDRPDETRWLVTLDPRQQTLWNGHAVEGEVVFPAAGYVDLGFAVAAQVWSTAEQPAPAQHIGAEQLRFERALYLSATEPTLMHIVATRQADGRLHVVFATQHSPRHASGYFVQRDAAAPNTTLDTGLDWVKGVDEQSVFYAWLRSFGLQYEGPFRAVAEAFYGEDRGLGRLSPASALGTERGFALHPATLDACFQVAFTSDAGLRVGEPSLFLPTELRALHCYAPSLEQAHWVSVRRAQHGREHALAVDIDIWDAGGRLLLRAEGFTATQLAANAPAPAENLLWQLEWTALPVTDMPAAESVQPRRWLVRLDDTGLGARVAELLEARGNSVLRVTRTLRSNDPFEVIAPGHIRMLADSPEHHRELLAHMIATTGGLDGLLDFWPLLERPSDVASADQVIGASQRVCVSIVEAVKALADNQLNPQLWLITREAWEETNTSLGARAVSSAVWGLGRVLAIEHPELRCSLVDVSGEASDIAKRIADEIGVGGDERELRLSRTDRRVARIVPVVERAQELAAPFDAPLAPLAPFAIEQAHGRMHLLAASEPAARPTDVVIEVETFRSPFDAESTPVPMALGGRVCQAALEATSGVSQGARVVWVGPVGPVKSVVAVPATDVWVVPDEFYLPSAVFSLAHYLATYHALLAIGRLERGNRVLVAGPPEIALPAAFVARWARAQVVVLGAADELASMQRLGLRNLVAASDPAAAQVVRETFLDARADLLLVAGQLPDTLKAADVLEPDGRCVWLATGEGASAPSVGSNQTLHAVALDRPLQQREPALRESLQMVRTLLEHKALPLLEFGSHKLDELSQLERNAWGTVTLEHARIAVARAPHTVRSDRTYLITGGLGGLGLTIARALAEAGARSLVTVGRSGPSAQAAAAMEELRKRGVTLTALQGDVALEHDVRRVMEYIQARLPPLAGIVHSAGVLADAIILRQDAGRFAQVFSAKASGAWNLVRAMSTHELDFLVLFSSAAGLLGSPGQSNYAAANTFLDGLASALRARGVPAKSVQWGPWSEVGLAARPDRGGRLASRGLLSLPPQAGAEVFMKVLDQPETVLAAMRFDGQVWAASTRAAAGDSRLAPTLRMPHSAVSLVPPPNPAALRPGRKSIAPLPGPATMRLPTSSTPAAQSGGDDLLNSLRGIIADLARVAPSRIEPGKPITAQGLDSLMLVELRTAIAQRFSVDVPIAALVKGPSLIELAARVKPEPSTSLQPATRDQRPPPTVPPTVRSEPQHRAVGGAGAAPDSVRPSRDARLPPDVQPLCAFRARTVQRVLVTGASGFLGRYLVSELLRRGAQQVCCLVRAESDERAELRLRELLDGDVQASPALRVLRADLEQEHFGLTQTRVRELLASADAVVHSAALVHFGKAYAALRQANVGAWLELLRESAASLPILHLVSTWGVFSSPAYAGKRVSEADWPTVMPSSGYRETKFVCEALARQARERGFPVQVHRPALIALHGQTGASNPKELCSALVKCVIASGLAPDLDLCVPFAPVDAIAEGIARVVLDGVRTDFSYHWIRRDPIPWFELMDFLDTQGVHSQRLPYTEWREQVAERVAGTALEPFVAWLPERLSPEAQSDGDFGYLEAALRENQPHPFENARTAAAVPGVLDGPAIDEEAWRRFVENTRKATTP